MRRSLTLLLAASWLSACFPGFAPTPTPMPSLDLVQRTPAAPCTAILLPGMLDSAETFRRQGFARLAAEKAPGLDIIAAAAHFGYYRKNLLLTRLHEDLVGPEIESGARVWLVGTSLGGIGSLLYARGENGGQRLPDADRLAGLVLLAPFLGEEELIDEIEAAGGPRKWHLSSDSGGAGWITEGQRAEGQRAEAGEAAWSYLLDWAGRSGEKPRIVLAWGDDDDLAPAARLAAQLLPERDVFSGPGDHDWATWRRLWAEMLDAGIFSECER